MSAVLVAVEFLHARKWLVELLLAAALIAGAVIWYHGRIDAAEQRGMQRQVDADTQALADLTDQVAKLTTQNAVLAAAAHAKYEADHAQNLSAAAAPVGTSQLCKPASAHGGAVDLRPGSGHHTGDAAQPAAAVVGGTVPAADNGFEGDRRALLGAFAALFDDQTGVIREYHGRGRVQGGEPLRHP